jgi:23S rRNA pseudouridine2605 synthase
MQRSDDNEGNKGSKAGSGASVEAKPGKSAGKSRSKSLAQGERLQRFLARCGVASRRAAETLITSGRVEINGVVITELGSRVVLGRDEVRFDGERLSPPEGRYVILLHKPVGVLCSRDDPERRPLVYGLLPPDTTLRSIGRLDFHTEGVLLFTNDGDLADRLAHPRHGVERIYEARVRGLPTPETLARLVRGVVLDDGPARVLTAEIVKATDKNAWVRVTLQEGRNREVRRIFERVGHPVMRLRRVRFAGLGLAGLTQGNWRTLEDREVADLEARGHVGAFGLPPDPRRRGVRAAGVAEAASLPRPKERPPRREDDAAPRGRPGAAGRRGAPVAPAPERVAPGRKPSTRTGASGGSRARPAAKPGPTGGRGGRTPSGRGKR